MTTFKAGDKVVPRVGEGAFHDTDYFQEKPYYIIEKDTDGDMVVKDDSGIRWNVVCGRLYFWFEHYTGKAK